MVEESDKSDSWGSLLINGILSKFNLVSEKKSDIHNDDQDKHLLIDPMRPKISKEVTKKVVTKKVVIRPNSNGYKIGNKFTSNQVRRDGKPPINDLFKERMEKGYSNNILQSRYTDSIEKKNKVKIMNEKSLKNSDQDFVKTNNIQSTDFMENKTMNFSLEDGSLAATC